MITTDTVLVLGAGASRDFGFPLGIDLLYEACSIGESHHLGLRISDAGHDLGDVSAFVANLRTSEWGSLDWYLEKSPEEVAVGKAVIAAIMLEFERTSNLFPPNSPKSHWYRLLLNLLDSDPPEFKHNCLAVVTFNYDRSLENYLFRVLRNPTRGRTEAEAFEDVQSIEIVHVHGSLGPLPFVSAEGLPYGSTPTGDAIATAADGIVVVGQAEDDTPEFVRARELLTNARRIAFLGFGFHPESVRRLGVFNERWGTKEKAATEVVATMRGITPDDWTTIMDQVLGGAVSAHTTAAIHKFLSEQFRLDR